MVNALIFLDEVSQFNGPLMIVPGSQRLESDTPDESTQGTSYKLRYTEHRGDRARGAPRRRRRADRAAPARSSS